MKIVQVANFVSPTSGGLRTSHRHLAAGYTRLGHDVVQVLPAEADGSFSCAEGRRVQLRSPAVKGTGYRVLVDIKRA